MSDIDCQEQEKVIRAIRSSDWDEKNNRWSSNLFTGPDTSVSRLEVLSLKKIFNIFHKELHKPPSHKLVKAGEISVGEIKILGKNFVVNGKAIAKSISVTQDPIDSNPAHALVNNKPEKKGSKKLPRSLALQIIKSLKLIDSPNWTLVKYRNISIATVIALAVAVIFYLIKIA